MEKRQIERFFQILSRFVPGKCKVILTGAAAGSLLGSVRLSRDIDFALEFLGNKDDWEKLEEAIHKTEQLTGVPAQYAQDISRWGIIKNIPPCTVVLIFWRLEFLSQPIGL